MPIGDAPRVVARRHAEDVRRVRADVADPGPGQRPRGRPGRRPRPARIVRLLARSAERVLADEAVASGRPGGTGRSAGSGCGRAPSRPPGRPSAGRSRPRSSRTAGPRRAGSRAPSARRPARTRSSRAGRDRSGPGGRRRGGARPPGRGAAAAPPSRSARRPVRAKNDCSNARSSGAPSTADTPRRVPGDPQRPERGVDHGVVVGQADRDERRVAEAGGRGLGERGERGLDRREPRVRSRAGRRVRVESVMRSSPCAHAPRSARSAARSVARPRWTWALRVPSGRPSASAISAYDRPSTWRRTTAIRWAGGRVASSAPTPRGRRAGRRDRRPARRRARSPARSSEPAGPASGCGRR